MPTPPPPKEHQFKPGQSGNPAGYSRGRRAVDDLLDLIAEKKADKAIAAKWLQAILEGDFRYMKEYLERRDGKVKDEVEVKAARPPVAFEVGDDGRNPDLPISAGPEAVADEPG